MQGHRAETLKIIHATNDVSLLRTLKRQEVLLGLGNNGGTLHVHSAGALSFQGSFNAILAFLPSER